MDQYITFYESVQGWPDGDAMARITCPRMTFVGSADEMGEFLDGVT